MAKNKKKSPPKKDPPKTSKDEQLDEEQLDKVAGGSFSWGSPTGSTIPSTGGGGSGTGFNHNLRAR